MSKDNEGPALKDSPVSELAELLPCPFWSKVDRRSPNECWPWNGAANVKGYGNFRSRSAHVVAYEMEKGSIPDQLEIDHICRNRRCVNPSHLEAVTHQENVRRAQPTHCKYGHLLSGDNIRLAHRMDGTRRVCKTCKRAQKRKYRLARAKLRMG